MKESLFDVFSGTFADGRPVEHVRSDRRLRQSVVSNLTRLFNTRRGAVPHRPDYGLPDLFSVYRNAGSSVDDLRTAIQESIETYEPRLRRVRVHRQERAESVLRLVFVVRAELITGPPVRFETTFESQSAARVEPVASRDGS